MAIPNPQDDFRRMPVRQAGRFLVAETVSKTDQTAGSPAAYNNTNKNR